MSDLYSWGILFFIQLWYYITKEAIREIDRIGSTGTPFLLYLITKRAKEQSSLIRLSKKRVLFKIGNVTNIHRPANVAQLNNQSITKHPISIEEYATRFEIVQKGDEKWPVSAYQSHCTHPNSDPTLRLARDTLCDIRLNTRYCLRLALYAFRQSDLCISLKRARYLQTP